MITPSPEKPLASRPFATGLVEVYTGNGKGKTTAALGTVMRALGHGLKVHVVFFMKGSFPYGEQEILAKLPNISFSTFGYTTFVDPREVKEEEKEQARKALAEARQAVLSNQFDIVLLDEVNVAVAWKLIKAQDVLQLIKDKPDRVEMILTGRYADKRIVEAADLVTEMVKIKHPYDKGILSRKGIDC